MSLKIRKIR